MLWKIERAQRHTPNFIDPPQYRNCNEIDCGLSYSEAAARVKTLREAEPDYSTATYRMIPQ